MTGIGSLVVQGARLHVFRNVFIKRSTSGSPLGSVWRLLSGSLKIRSGLCPSRFGADCLCFGLKDEWLADLFVY